MVAHGRAAAVRRASGGARSGRAWIAEHRLARVPWQRDDPSIAGTELGALEVDGGAALVRVKGDRVSVLQLEARDEDAAADLLAAARAHGTSLHYVNVPEGDPPSAALLRLGGALDRRQLEMALPR